MNMKDIRNVNWNDDIEKFGNIIEDARFEFRPGVYGICFSGHNALIVEKTLGNFIVGGGIENDESDEECLIREFKEEIGYDVSIIKWLEDIVEYVEVREWDKNYMKPMRFYLVELGEKVSEPIEDDHIMKWADVDTIVDNMYLKGQGHILKKYRVMEEEC